MTNIGFSTYQQTTSQQLHNFSNNIQTADVTIAQLIDSLQQQSFASVFFILALLCFLPGVSILAGAILVLPCLQLVLGKPTLVLPKKIARKSIDSQRLQNAFRWLLPRLRWLEKRIKPRWQILSSSKARQVLGLVILLNAIIVLIPFPLSNILPAIALVFLSIGMLEKDGFFIVLGVMISAVAIFTSWAVVHSLFLYLKPFFL